MGAVGGQPAVQAAPAAAPAAPTTGGFKRDLRKPAPQQVAASFDNPNIGKLIAEAEGLYKLAAFAPAEKKNRLLAEAANAARQAATAISMKKAGKKPKKDESVQPGQFVEPSNDAKQQIKANNQQSADKAAIGRAEMGIMPVDEEEKKGLYYYVNQRKKKGISRSKNSPNAPSEQDWKNAAKTAKK